MAKYVQCQMSMHNWKTNIILFYEQYSPISANNQYGTVILCKKKREHAYSTWKKTGSTLISCWHLVKRWQAWSRFYVTAEIRQDKQTSRKLASVWARGMMLKWGRTWSVHSATWIGPAPRLLCKLAVPCICTCEHTNARMLVLGCLLLRHLMICNWCKTATSMHTHNNCHTH